MEVVGIRKKEPVIEYENKHFKVYSQEVDFGNFKKKYFVAEYGQKAAILILKNDSILMVRQYRLLIDRPAWEIPGGKIDQREDPKEAAVRECEEETGIRCKNVQPLVHCYQGLDSLSARVHLFYTNQFEQVREFEFDFKEVDMIRWVPFQECLEMIKSGEILDNFTIVALLYYQVFKGNFRVEV